MAVAWLAAFLLASLAVAPGADAVRLRARAGKAAATVEATAKVPAGSIQKVIKMMEDLVKEMDAEQEKDEQEFKAFSKWCVDQQAATSAGIAELQTQIEVLEAALAELYSKKEGLENHLAELKANIKETRSQIQ